MSIIFMCLFLFSECNQYHLFDNPPSPAALPEVITSKVMNITKFSADLGGEVTNEGGAPVRDRGVCYNTSQTPTINNNKVNISSGKGAFSATISGLQDSTVYYVRAYARNSGGITYGNQVTFMTGRKATVRTNPAKNITISSAVVGGDVTDEGSSPVSDRGICYSLKPNPTLKDIQVSISSGKGAFSEIISGLSPSQTYYVKAYAINRQGTAYGQEISFTTPKN